VLGSSVGDVVWFVGDGNGIGVTGGAVGSNVNGGGDGKVYHDASEQPSSCRRSTTSGKALVSCLPAAAAACASRAGRGDRLIISPVPLPAAPTAAFMDTARIRRAAAAAFFIAAAALGAAAAAGASVAVEAATAA
jgi:hypothetical protein